MNSAVKALLGAILVTLISLPAFAVEESTPQFHPAAKMAEQINNGQDITRPVTRVDARYQFVNVPGGYHQDIYTLRSDGAIKFSDKWELALRGDVPTVYGDVPAGDNEHAKMQFALGDIVTQVVPVYIVNERVGLGFGVQLVWPTATNDQSGTGKYTAIPLAGVRVSLPEISNGSFFLPYARYEVSYAGSSQRNDISKLQFAPCLNVMLPKQFFAVLWPNPEIAYDFEQKAWTIPADFMIGKMFAKNIVGSIECFIPMFEDKDYVRSYNFKTEARMGFFF
jgi:hypothetical protein